MSKAHAKKLPATKMFDLKGNQIDRLGGVDKPELDALREALFLQLKGVDHAKRQAILQNIKVHHGAAEVGRAVRDFNTNFVGIDPALEADISNRTPPLP